METSTDILRPENLEDKLTALDEGEMQLFQFLSDKEYGAQLTADTDILLAQMLDSYGLADLQPDNKVIIPKSIRESYKKIWSDETILRWRKRNWMYKCIEAGRYLYGVMTWDILRQLFGLRYPHAEMDEIRELFDSTPSYYKWFAERNGRLVLNGFEKEDYCDYLEKEIQGDTPFYIPSREQVEELYEKGCLLSCEAHAKMQDFIAETYGLDPDNAGFKVHELYEMVNSRVRVNDAAEMFASSGEEGESDFAFPSDEAHVRFIELYMEMSRECRVRDNRGHDYYEMVGIMAERNKQAPSDPAGGKKNSRTVIKPAKIGRNDPCPCGSGKKYKNCCGRN